MLDRVIIKNISSLFSIRIAGYVIPLLTLPYLVRVLDPQGYGTFIYCVAICQYFIIAVNYGFDLSATKLIAEEKNDINIVSSLFWNVFSIRLTIALVGFIILYLVSFISDEINNLFSILSYCYISAIAAAFFPQWLFQGKEQLGVISIVRVVSQIVTIPFIFKKPCYAVNHSPRIQDELQQKLFIFKRIKNLETGKLLTAKEILKSDFAHSYSDLSVKYNVQTINNNEEDIKCLTSEIDRQIKGEEISDKEDLKINDKFWKIYEQFSNKKIIGPLKPKISPSFLRNNLDLLN